MMSTTSRKQLPYDTTATYKIVVLGGIDPTWSDRLEGMTICQASVEAGHTTTTLEGELTDQAAMAGVLNTLYELRLTLLSVERLEI